MKFPKSSAFFLFKSIAGYIFTKLLKSTFILQDRFGHRTLGDPDKIKKPEYLAWVFLYNKQKELDKSGFKWYSESMVAIKVASYIILYFIAMISTGIMISTLSIIFLGDSYYCLMIMALVIISAIFIFGGAD